MTAGNGTGNKYHRDIRKLPSGKVDVYCVIDAFDVRCPARAHAIKKLLCAGIRGKGDSVQDLKETIDAVLRAIELEQSRVDEAAERMVSGVDPGVGKDFSKVFFGPMPDD